MLVQWNPYKEFERSFDDVFGRAWRTGLIGNDRGRDVQMWKPAVNVYEDKENLVLEAQLPGIDMKDIEVSVTDHTLELRGDRKLEHEGDGEGYHVREARYGSFARSFTLPSYVDPGKAQASYDRGVVTIAVPKQEEAKPKLIPIKAK